MKKNFLSLLALAALVSGTFLSTGKAVQVNAANDYGNPPAAGELDPASYFTKGWQDSVGTRRLSDRAVMVTDTSDFGYRGTIEGRKFNLKDFDITIDASQLIPNTAMTIITGASKTYTSEEGMVLNFDIVKSSTTENLYLVTCSTTVNFHNKSIPGFSNGTWAEDANFTGVQFTIPDGIVSISVDYVDETTSTVTVNGNPFNVATSDLYSRCNGEYNQSVNIGMMNNAGATQHYVIESIGDDTDKVYFGEDGAYTITKKTIEELKTVDLSEPTADLVLETIDKYNNIPWSNLYSWDKAYLQAGYDEVKAKIDAAITDEVAVVLLDTAVTDVEEIVNDLTTVESVDAAIAAIEEANGIKDLIASPDELEPDLKQQYDAALARLATANDKIPAAAKAVLESSVAAYEAAVAEVTTGAAAAAAEKVKANIPTKYAEFVTEEEMNAFTARIEAADATFKENTTIEHQNWIQGSELRVVETAENGYDLVSYGDPFTETPEESDGLYNKEKISALDFSATIKFESVPEAMGSWITFGIMEKPEMWINAEDDSVQNNKGVFFLISRINASKLQVQAFLCSLTSNRFYDSALTQIIQIPAGEDINIRLYTETEEIAGVTEEYFKIAFNDIEFNQETIAARKIKTCLGVDCTGYFITASSGYSQSNPALYSIKDINKKAPNGDTIVADIDYTPTSSDTEKSFTNGSDSAIVTFNLDTKGKELTSVTVDGTEVAAENYTFDADKNKITFTNAFLNTLTVGDHTITAKTSEGEVSWTLHVTEGEGPVEPVTPDNGVNVGLIVGCTVGGVVVVAGVTLLVLFLLKKKKNSVK